MPSVQTKISAVHVVAGLHPSAGGPSRTVAQLTDHLAREPGVKVSLLSQSLTGQPTVQSTVNSVNRKVYDTKFTTALALGLPLRCALRDLLSFNRPSLIHSHGLWLPANAWAARTARREKVPLLIHTRGMLEPWALDYRARKKRLAMSLYQRRDLEAATLFFVTAFQEVESLRRLGLKQPVAVIPNGVSLPSFGNKGGVRSTESQLSYLRNAVFIGRIHPVKGLLNLVEAWGRLQPACWKLRIAGPDECEHLAEVLQRVRDLGLEESVEYLGEVEGEVKSTLLETADLFVLPSFTENFGVVVAEALAHGVPVITTRGTPWEGLLHHGCGWWVEPTSDALTEAFREAVNMGSTNLRTMGENGRKYAAEFDWTTIAQQTAEVYRWVLGQGPQPGCVICD